MAPFSELKEIITLKKTKSGEKETDIKKEIASIKIAGNELIMILAAGNDAYLKPEFALCAMEKYIKGFSAGDYDCVRTGILDKEFKYI